MFSHDVCAKGTTTVACTHPNCNYVLNCLHIHKLVLIIYLNGNEKIEHHREYTSMAIIYLHGNENKTGVNNKKNENNDV